MLTLPHTDPHYSRIIIDERFVLIDLARMIPGVPMDSAHSRVWRYRTYDTTYNPAESTSHPVRTLFSCTPRFLFVVVILAT